MICANYQRKRDDEREVLALAGYQENVRLACQLKPAGDLKVRLLLQPETGSGSMRAEGMARERDVAVLFVDVRGFTSFAEKHLAFDVLHLLNRYFDRMGTLVDFNGGHVIAFLGDGMLCLFEHGEPIQRANSAVSCAVSMLDAVACFTAYTEENFNFPHEVGIGVAWGRAVIGQVGYYKHSALNVIGDVVNTAARVQDATKEAGSPLLITDSLRPLIESGFAFGRTHEAQLRGKEGTHRLHEVTCALLQP